MSATLPVRATAGSPIREIIFKQRFSCKEAHTVSVFVFRGDRRKSHNRGMIEQERLLRY